MPYTITTAKSTAYVCSNLLFKVFSWTLLTTKRTLTGCGKFLDFSQTFLNTRTTYMTIQQSGKHDSFGDILKSLGSRYDSSLRDDATSIMCNIAFYVDNTTLCDQTCHLLQPLNWLLNLSVIYKRLWTGACRIGKGLLISMLKKINKFCLLWGLIC